jgi:hypothetical protein
VSDIGPAPIFVVGSMRSGSTLLRLILDSHPDIACPGETGFMAGVRAVKDVPGWRLGHRWYERLGWTEQEIDERLHDFYAGIFERYAREQGKLQWAEKTPFHTEHVAEMGALFPEARFVGIVRHPGAVAASLCRHFHYELTEALVYWRATNAAMLRGASDLGDRFTLVRYEDLVEHGDTVLPALMDVLGMRWSDSLLHHHEVQHEKGAPRAVEGSTVTSDPIDARRAHRWAASLRPEDRTALPAASPLAECFGYCWDEPLVRPVPYLARHGVVPGTELSVPPGADRDGHAAALLLAAQADPTELARRLLKTEQALARARSRRAVRLADAVRKVQHGRSFDDVRAAWSLVVGANGGTSHGAHAEEARNGDRRPR